MKGNTQAWGPVLRKVWQHIDWNHPAKSEVWTERKLMSHQRSALLSPTTSWHEADPELVKFNHKTVNFPVLLKGV